MGARKKSFSIKEPILRALLPCWHKDEPLPSPDLSVVSSGVLILSISKSFSTEKSLKFLIVTFFNKHN